METENINEAYLLYKHAQNKGQIALFITQDGIAFSSQQYASLDAEWESLSDEEYQSRVAAVKQAREQCM